MNILKKAYARGFQLCFKIAIPFLPYRNSTILNNIEVINNEIKFLNKKKPIIITDKAIIKALLLNDLLASLNKAKISYTIYDNEISNQTIDNVENAVKDYIENNNDCIIAIGGGSVIDCAKALGARIAKPKKSLEKMAGLLKVRHKISTLFAKLPLQELVVKLPLLQ